MPSLKLPKLPRRRPGSPSLKDRAAALKASAARVMRHRTSTAKVAPPDRPSPRLAALVLDWQAERNRLNDPALPDGPEADAIGEQESRLHFEILGFPSASIQDMHLKLATLREDAGGALPIVVAGQSADTVSGAAWAGLLRDIEHLAAAPPVAETAPDPILAAIEASKAAHAFEGAVGPINADLVALGQEFDDLHAAWRRAEEANRAPQALRERVTRAGKAHGLPYETAESIACSLPGVEEACNAEQAAFEALEPVMCSIFAQPAHTLAGLAVKARATIPAMWMGGNFEEDAADPNQEWEKRAVSQFIQAACAAAGVDWRGEPITPSEIHPKA